MILVIDDEPELRKLLRIALEGEGYEVLTAKDGDEGLALLAEKPVSLLLTDILMPGKAGNEIIPIIRNLSPDLPIIAMSGGGRTGNKEFLEIAKKQGADRIIHKPFDMNQFLDLVGELLAGRKS